MVTICFTGDGEPTRVDVYYFLYSISDSKSLVFMRMKIGGELLPELPMGEMDHRNESNIVEFLRSYVSFRLRSSVDVHNLDIRISKVVSGDLFLTLIKSALETDFGVRSHSK